MRLSARKRMRQNSRPLPLLPSRWPRRLPRRSRFSGACFAGARMYRRAGGKIQKQGRRATRPCVGTNGSGASAESRRRSAGSAQTRHSSPSVTTLSVRILPERHPVIRSISRSECTRCCRTKHAGFWPLISTRSPGCRTLRRFATRQGRRVFRSPSNDHARETAHTLGFSLPSRYRRRTQDDSVRFSSRRQWIVVPISASIRMIGSSRARTQCRWAASAI